MHLRGGKGEGDSAPPASGPIGQTERVPGSSSSEPEPASLAQPGVRKAAHRSHKRRRSFARRSASWAIVLGVAVAVAVLLRLFVFQTFYVPSGSMEPTLMPGDRMVVLKLGLGTIHRGEIIVFKRPPGDHEDPQNEDLVKRVIGLPGQTIWSSGGTIYIDGKPIAQPWLPRGQAPGKAIPRLKIPPNDFFVMGDNRPVSYDSRYWTPHYVPRSYIIGQVIVVIWRSGHPYFKTF